ncbi:MAG: DUF2177 family protein [Alphaproteobacteria bacterium]|nr:DUF2177 family protein [Alphaproteobacteria bacterium]
MKAGAAAWLVTWLAGALVFIALDAIWLSQVSPLFYPAMIGEVLSGEVQLAPAIAFYVIYTGGIAILAAWPAVASGGWKKALALGAVMGLVAYGAYDLTNQATLKAWDIRVTLADLAWGTFATAIAAAAGAMAGRRVR